MSENSKTLSQRTLKEFTPPIVLRLARKLLYGKPNREVRGQEQGPEYYDQTFLNREHWRQHYTQSPYYPLWAVIADRIAGSEPTSVLDIGCGPGQFAALLQDKGLPQYLGIDFSPKRIKQAREVCPEFDFVIADVFETDLLSAYDTVVCLEFLEHVERDLEILGRIRGGTHFYGTVPNFPSRAHVRHFESAQEVYERYEKRFHELAVDTHLADTKGRLFFVMEGIIA